MEDGFDRPRKGLKKRGAAGKLGGDGPAWDRIIGLRRRDGLMKQRLGLFLFCIAALILVEGALGAGQADDPSVLTIKRIFDSNDFKGESFGPARWLKDGSGYTTLKDSNDLDKAKDIVRHDPQTGERDILVPAEKLIPKGQSKPLSIDGYTWSDDGKRLLIFTNAQRVWRANTRGDYWVLTPAHGRLKKLGGDAPASSLMFAKFSPDGRKVAYVRENNLYVQNVGDLEIAQLTHDGSETVINGTSDWVYEEEFYLRDGFRWSPNGKWIAYWQFDTSGVPMFHLIDNTRGLYPEITTFGYPKAGQTNSAVRVGVVHVEGGSTRWFELSDDTRNHYIPTMDWADNSKDIVLQHLNRLQNRNEVILANVRKGASRTVMTERDAAWLDVTDCLKWFDDGRRFTWLSERDGWRHLYAVSRSGRKAKLLTPGAFDVIDLECVDKEGGWAYYTASPDNPTQRYLYRVSLDANSPAERITPQDHAGTHAYDISPDAKWAFHTYSSFGVPPVTELVSLPGHETVRVLADNAELRETLEKLDRGPSEFFRVDIGDGVELDGWCIRPPQFDPNERYPTLFHVYGEPAGQTVLDRWGGKGYLWHLMLAQKGYVIASVDNRGTPAPRGRQWRKSVYHQVGILASADQAAAVGKIVETRPFVDPNAIGIWGWSGGGSMSLNAIFRYPDLYRMAMAIAFVSDERFYDTIYQERYMGLPDDNAEGYKNGSPITFAHQLRGRLLLVHGTADDNVHYQNCEALVNELVKHDKAFTMMSYPGRTHGIGEGDGTTVHLYSLLTRYLEENLPGARRAPEGGDR